MGGKDTSFFPLVDVRIDLLLDEAPHRLAEHLMLLRELHALDLSPCPLLSVRREVC